MAQHNHPPETVAAVGKAFRAGQLSIRDIARKYKVDESTIRYWRDKFKWKQDLRKQVRVEANRRSMVEKPAGGKRQPPRVEGQSAEETRAQAEQAGQVVMDESDDAIVDAFAEQGAVILRTHRRQVGALRERCMMLAHELEANRRYYRRIINEISREPPSPKSRKGKPRPWLLAELHLDTTQKQTQALRDLAQAVSRLIPLERQAYALNVEDDERGYEERLKELYDNEPEHPADYGHAVH